MNLVVVRVDAVGLRVCLLWVLNAVMQAECKKIFLNRALVTSKCQTTLL